VLIHMHQPGLGTLLRAVIASLDGDVQALYDELELPLRPRFYPILRSLAAQQRMTVGELAEAAGVSQPAMTQTVAEMTKLGLVESAAGKDARQRLISLSALGRQIVEQVRPLWDAIADAAARLDRELECPLSGSLRSTLELLERESFGQRIRRNLDA